MSEFESIKIQDTRYKIQDTRFFKLILIYNYACKFIKAEINKQKTLENICKI